MRIYLLSFFLFLFITNFAVAQNMSVLTQHNNTLRTGWNNNETTLTTSNVNVNQFGKLFSLSVDDQVYSQPLVVANLTIGGAKHNVVFVATVNNSVYAYDGDKATLYWQKNYTVAGQRPPKNSDMTGACGGFYLDFSGNIGIVGTPVIDSVAQTMYFVARSTNGTGAFEQYLHAVSILDGSERSGSPVLIKASTAGTGDGNINGVVSFDPQKNNQRQGLTLVNGTVYVSFSSHCDWGPYHGWILGYDKNTLAQKIVFNDSANGFDGGLWQAGGGIAVDNNGNLFIVTGNGSVGLNGNIADLTNRGESALKLTPSGNTLAITSFFTPNNYLQLEGSDLDYGAMGNFLIPNSNYYFTGCKDGTLYLLNKDNMGGYNAASNNVQQAVPLNSSKTLRCQPTYFKGTNSEYVYVWSENDFLTALPFNRTTNMFDVSKQVTSPVSGPQGASGAELSVSSNGGATGSAIVWASYASDGNANQSVRPGILRAFDANDVTRELWNNSMNSTRDNAGDFAKFSSPTIANGHVYLPTFSNKVAVYGVLPDSVVQSDCPTVNLALNKTAVASSVQDNTVPASNVTDGNTGTRWGSAFSDPQWIYVDLGQSDSICRVVLIWQTASAKNFQIQVSDDAQNWTTAATLTNNGDLTNYISLSAQGRYVRMYGTARTTAFGYSLYEFQVNGSIPSSCKKPTGLSTTNVTTSSATLNWTASNADTYVVKYYISSSTAAKTVPVNGTSLAINNLGCSTSYSWQVAGVCGGVQGPFTSPAVFTTSNCVNCGLLPTRTYTQDVGSVSLPGKACYTGVTSYDVTGSGNDIYNAVDQFRYVYRTFAGDGTMQAKITSIDNANPNNKAGVMFRETTDSTSRNVFLGITSANGLTVQARLDPAVGTYSGAVPNIKAPGYLRLVKEGNLYLFYASVDSINWTQLNSSTAFMNSNGPITGGLAVTSADGTKLSTAHFDQVGFYSYGGSQANIALNKPSYGSSWTDLNHTGNFANDGDTTTKWTSGTGSPQWYYVDFGQPFKLNRVVVNWGANIGKTYQLQISNDAQNWKTVQQIIGNTVYQNTLIVNDSARFVRVFGTESANGVGYTIAELQAFGDTIATVNDDVARGKQAAATSDAGTGFGAGNITDGDFTTRWSSAPNSDPQAVGVDLGGLYAITQVNLTWELNNAKNFEIQISNDGNTWSAIKTISNNTAYTNFIPLNTIARYIRVYCTARNGTNYSIYDMQVIGTAYTPPPASASGISGFNVYPNPTTGEVSFNYDGILDQTVEVKITDLAGKLIKNYTIAKATSPVLLNDVFEKLPAGNYTLSIKTAKGKASTVIIKL